MREKTAWHILLRTESGKTTSAAFKYIGNPETQNIQ